MLLLLYQRDVTLTKSSPKVCQGWEDCRIAVRLDATQSSLWGVLHVSCPYSIWLAFWDGLGPLDSTLLGQSLLSPSKTTCSFHCRCFTKPPVSLHSGALRGLCLRAVVGLCCLYHTRESMWGGFLASIPNITLKIPPETEVSSPSQTMWRPFLSWP